MSTWIIHQSKALIEFVYIFRLDEQQTNLMFIYIFWIFDLALKMSCSSAKKCHLDFYTKYIISAEISTTSLNCVYSCKEEQNNNG